ncbi:MAG: Crp/Fnr family transcriptional regulator [Bacteroidales bacterium]
MTGTYDTILQLPLFQGLSRVDLTNTIERFSFHFQKYKDGERIVTGGSPSTHVIFIMNGEIRSELHNDKKTLRITEIGEAPCMITPLNMYGHIQTHLCDVFAVGNVGIMKIEKQSFFSMIQTNEIFYYNILNYLSGRNQISTKSLLNIFGTNARKRFALWLLPLTNSYATKIILNCRRTNLASILGLSRPTLQTMLEGMVEEDIISIEDRKIHINDRTKLYDILNSIELDN